MTSEVLGAVVPGAVAEVISGDEEARLSFHGAVYELDTAAAPFVVVDLGEKTQPSRVHAEDRNVQARRASQATKQRSVAADRHARGASLPNRPVGCPGTCPKNSSKRGPASQRHKIQ